MNERTWDQKYAFYAASLYRLGMYIDAGLVSAIMFERYIEDEFTRYPDLQKSRNGDFLWDAIRQLSAKNPEIYDLALLDELRRIRNKEIIHPNKILKGLINTQFKQELKDKLAKITRFVWKMLDPETYSRYQSLGGIPLLEADYAVMEIKELFQDDMKGGKGGNYNSFRMGDFENLFSMRNKMLHLARHTRERLLCNYKNLDIDVISRVDTTSAYVWLAINLHQETESGLRDRITGASASILATPLDFRIYLDFGGEAVIERQDYYAFLQSDLYRDFVDGYSDESLEMFDVDWYSFITRQATVKDVTSTELSNQLAVASVLLQGHLKDKQIITWNRNLLGFIIPRSQIEFSVILEKLEIVIKLYYYFEKYRVGNLARKIEFPWLPTNEYLTDCTKQVLHGHKLM